MDDITYIILFIIGSFFTMIGTNVLYDIASAFIPIAVLTMVIIGIIVGFVVALKNTFSVYKKVYTKKGKQR